VRILLPAGDPRTDLTPVDLAGHYAYPDHPWIRANMVSSLDGAVTVDGRARGLSGDADRALFGLLRALADVVLVGAGTARAEGYQPARARPEFAGLRGGRPPAPRIALVTQRADLDPASVLFTQANPRTLVFTCASADAARLEELREVADVHLVGQAEVDLDAVRRTLTELGLRRILTEGGPHLLGALIRRTLVDEFAMTFSPTLAGPGAGRIVDGAPTAAPSAMELAGLVEADGFLFVRYVRTDRIGLLSTDATRMTP
jgi:riboflavin biosynthesis pyrimidine reductase